MKKKQGDDRPGGGLSAAADRMTSVLPTFSRPDRTGWDDACVGLEPTFQSERSVRMWQQMSAEEGGEDRYFESEYMLGTQRKVAREIVEKYRKKSREHDRGCMFDRVELEEELDQWGVPRQNLEFRWPDEGLKRFQVRFTIDPETFEYSIKPVPLLWFYEDEFVEFLDEFVWDVPGKHGLSASIAHGGCQFSLSAKTFLSGSLLADDIAYRLNHPELSCFVMDWPNPDDRAFRATSRRAAAFRRILEAYWAGGFHPRAIGTLTPESCYLDRGFGPHPDPATGLMDPERGPIGDAREVFQTNFAFARAVRLQAQSVHPGYWQSASPKDSGYRADQIMRYSEGNLNRMQIAGELHVKSDKVLDPDRVPELDAPLDIAMLYDATICVGCNACTNACREWNGTSPETDVRGLYDAPQQLSADTWTLIQ
ncbi:MAG: hypothetical protein HY815_30575, partial [Candidatus Riflebacteria bacterium]|nr:hypothetical protein [Candidatus Riflebacteria bacterium]